MHYIRGRHGLDMPNRLVYMMVSVLYMHRYTIYNILMYKIFPGPFCVDLMECISQLPNLLDHFVYYITQITHFSSLHNHTLLCFPKV